MSLPTSQSTRSNGPLARISKENSTKVVARRPDSPSPLKSPTSDSFVPTPSHINNNYNNGNNNFEMDLAFDDIAEDLKLLEFDSNKVGFLLDYYNLNQDICLNSIQGLKESFEESHRDLTSQLQTDLQRIADKKYQEYLRELEELNNHRKSEYQEALNTLSMKHHSEIKTYVEDIDVKQKELLEQIENFDKVQSKEFETQLKKDHDELKETLSRLSGDLGYSRSFSRSTVQIKPRRLGSTIPKPIPVKQLPINSNSRQQQQQQQKEQEPEWISDNDTAGSRWAGSRGEGFGRNRVDITALHNEIKQVGGTRQTELKDSSPLSSASRESGATQRRNEKTLPVPPSHFKQNEMFDSESDSPQQEHSVERKSNSADIERASIGRPSFNVEPQGRPSGGPRQNIVRQPRQIATKEGSNGASASTAPTWAAGRKRDLPESNELERTSGRMAGYDSLERTSGRIEPTSTPLFVERDLEREELERPSASPRREPLPRSSTRDGPTRTLHQSTPNEGTENSVIRPSRPLHTTQQTTTSDDEVGEQAIRMSNENIQLSRNPGKPRDVPVDPEGDGDSLIPRASKRNLPLRSQGSYNANSQQPPSLPPSWKKERAEVNEPVSREPLSPSGQREEVTKRTVPLRRNMNESAEPLVRESSVRNQMSREPLSPRQGLPRNWPINKNTENPPTPSIPVPSTPTTQPTMPSIPSIPLSNSTSTPNQTISSSPRSMPPVSPHVAVSPTLSPRPKPLPPPKFAENAPKSESSPEPEPVVFVEIAQISCGLCKLSFDENETVLLKEVNRSFCLPCSNDVIERAKLKGLNLTRVTK